MVLSRSIETWPSVSERMSRIVASVTNPSVTRTFPSGVLKRFCSVNAMLSWSWLMIPLPSRVWPSGIWERGVAWTVAIACLARELREPARRRRGVELRGRAPSRLERAAIEVRGRPPLAQVVERDREVVGDVRVLGLQAVRLEVRRLRLGPAALRGVEVPEREVQGRALRLARQVRAEIRFERLGAREVGQGGEAREGGGILGIERQRPPVGRGGGGRVPAPRLHGGEAQVRVDVRRIRRDRRRVVA